MTVSSRLRQFFDDAKKYTDDQVNTIVNNAVPLKMFEKKQDKQRLLVWQWQVYVTTIH